MPTFDIPWYSGLPTVNQSTVRTQLDPPYDGGCHNDSRKEVAGELVVAGCDAPEILEPREHAFDQVARPVGFAIVCESIGVISLVRD